MSEQPVDLSKARLQALPAPQQALVSPKQISHHTARREFKATFCTQKRIFTQWHCKDRTDSPSGVSLLAKLTCWVSGTRTPSTANDCPLCKLGADFTYPQLNADAMGQIEAARREIDALKAQIKHLELKLEGSANLPTTLQTMQAAHKQFQVRTIRYTNATSSIAFYATAGSLPSSKLASSSDANWCGGQKPTTFTRCLQSTASIACHTGINQGCYVFVFSAAKKAFAKALRPPKCFLERA